MSRRHRAEKRVVQPDAKYGDVIVSKFINAIMVEGKRSVSERIVYKAFSLIEEKHAAHIKEKRYNGILDFFHNALNNVKPSLEVRSRRVGGATYQVPIEVSNSRAQALGLRWIIGAARKRSEKTMSQRLSNELVDAEQSRGASVKKREDTHKMADANRTFAHYRL